MQALASLVFTSSLVHVMCSTDLKPDEPNAEGNTFSTCSGPNATCADSNFAPGIKKGRANVLLQSRSEMQRGNKTQSCELCDSNGLCWALKGNKGIWAPDDVTSVARTGSWYQNSALRCVAKCNSAQSIVMYSASMEICYCFIADYRQNGKEIKIEDYYESTDYWDIYEQSATTCTTTTTTTTTTESRRRRSCASTNACQASTSDPICGNECYEFSTALTCCETCDVTGDSRRRDGRRRKGHLCQRRRG